MGFKWKHRHTSLAVVFVVWLVSYLDRMVMSTAIPYIATDFNLSTSEMGVVMSAFFAGYALFQIPGGILSDRRGRCQRNADHDRRNAELQHGERQFLHSAVPCY